MATLERRGPMGFDFVFIQETQSPISVGKSPDNDLVITGDDTVSRLHARLDHLGPAWCITDLGARNGTRVNGVLIMNSRRLSDGDEILLGRTRLVLRDPSARGERTTTPTRTPPQLTRTEMLVLIELCRPALSAQAFTPPASVDTIARALVVSPGAVQQHLGHLYDKFLIEPQDGVSRRVLLANEAIATGAVTMKDLRPSDDG